MFLKAFMGLQFRFVIFWQMEIGVKAPHKMLVKLTLGLFLKSNNPIFAK